MLSEGRGAVLTPLSVLSSKQRAKMVMFCWRRGWIAKLHRSQSGRNRELAPSVGGASSARGWATNSFMEGGTEKWPFVSGGGAGRPAGECGGNPKSFVKSALFFVTGYS